MNLATKLATIRINVFKRMFCSFMPRGLDRSSNVQLQNLVRSSSFLANSLMTEHPVSSTRHELHGRNYSSGKSNRDKKSKKDSKSKVFLSDEELSHVINVEQFKLRLSHAVDKLKDEFVKQLSLRTSIGAIESLTIEYENEEYSLNELAQISRKNPKMIVLNMVNNPQAIRGVLEAINKSGFNLNPQQEGTTIYVPIPPLTREHRENLSKNARTLFVRTSDDLRDIQNDVIRKMKRHQGQFSEDLLYSAQQQIMKITHDYVSECEMLMERKQTELTGKES